MSTPEREPVRRREVTRLANEFFQALPGSPAWGAGVPASPRSAEQRGRGGRPTDSARRRRWPVSPTLSPRRPGPPAHPPCARRGSLAGREHLPVPTFDQLAAIPALPAGIEPGPACRVDQPEGGPSPPPARWPASCRPRPAGHAPITGCVPGLLRARAACRLIAQRPAVPGAARGTDLAHRATLHAGRRAALTGLTTAPVARGRGSTDPSSGVPLGQPHRRPRNCLRRCVRVSRRAEPRTGGRLGSATLSSMTTRARPAQRRVAAPLWRSHRLPLGRKMPSSLFAHASLGAPVRPLRDPPRLPDPARSRSTAGR